MICGTKNNQTELSREARGGGRAVGEGVVSGRAVTASGQEKVRHNQKHKRGRGHGQLVGGGPCWGHFLNDLASKLNKNKKKKNSKEKNKKKKKQTKNLPHEGGEFSEVGGHPPPFKKKQRGGW